jgi:asparagine synthase (glutamine-hydrolysing)
VRCPLLDHHVIEFAFRLPTEIKMPKLQAKHLLRQIAERRLPSELLTRPKHGFTAPVNEWIRTDYAERFAADVFADGAAVQTFVDMGTVRRWFDEHRRGQQRWGYALWAVWMLERWHNVHREQRRLASMLHRATV